MTEAANRSRTKLDTACTESLEPYSDSSKVLRVGTLSGGQLINAEKKAGGEANEMY